jgi:trans-aconitate methyltransferase
VLSHLSSRFDCTAVDRSPAMLENLARLVPDAERVEADLRQVRLERRFEMVLLHDAIDYMRSAEDVDRALATARAHLAPGGVLFVAPTYTRESFVDGELADEGDADGGVTYVTFVHDADPSDSEYELILVYFLRHADTREVKVVEDRHRCGLFSEAEW